MNGSPQFVVNPGPIIGAGALGDITSAAAPLPNVGGTIQGWFKPMTIGIITSLVGQGEAKPTINQIDTAGCLLPGDAETLKLLPEGARSWKSCVLYVLPGLDLETDDNVVVTGETYRVLRSRDFSDFGYERFDLMQLPT